MIESFVIEGLRGIRWGRLDGLFPLTIFLGPNNSGKSTCLEAMWLLANSSLAETIQAVLTRRGWIGLASFEGLLPAGKAELELTASGPTRWEGDVEPGSGRPLPVVVAEGRQQRKLTMELETHPGSFRLRSAESVDVTFAPDPHPQRHQDPSGLRRAQRAATITGGGNPPAVEAAGMSAGHPMIGAAFVDPSVTPRAIVDSLAAADQAGEDFHQRLVSYMRTLDPKLREIRNVRSHGEWIPRTSYQEGGVPLALVGDGMKRLFQVACSMAIARSGVALLEDPECFQHPRSLAEMAKVIWTAVDGGTQVVMSTHSLEFVDLLGAEARASDPRLGKFGVFRMALEDGQLRTNRVEGANVLELRDTLAEDLRR